MTIMNEPVINSVSELFLHRAAVNISKGWYAKAANYILLTVTEFDEHVDIFGFLDTQLKKLDYDSVGCFILEILEEASWVSFKEKITQMQLDKIVGFLENAKPVFMESGYELTLQSSSFQKGHLRSRPFSLKNTAPADCSIQVG